MTFKDGLGVVEELKVEMIEALPPLPAPGVYAVVGSAVHIRWIERDGKFVKDEVVEYKAD